MKCKNCGQNNEGKYCNNCGQKTNVKRLNSKYLRDEIVTSIFQVDRGILFTIKELIIRPGHTIREFINGKRVKHFKPLSFLLIAATIYVIANKILGNPTFVNSFIDGFNAYEESSDVSSSEELNIFEWMIKYQTHVVLITMLIFSLASYIAFIESRYNLIEHLVINSYITGLQFIIYTIFSFFSFNDDSIFAIIPSGTGFLYNALAYFQFFNDKKISTKIGLLLTTYFLFFIILLTVVLIVMLMIKFLI